LHYACFWGYQQVAEDLIAHGAIVSLANKDGDTPLDKARGSLAKRFHGTRLGTFLMSHRKIVIMIQFDITFSQN